MTKINSIIAIVAVAVMSIFLLFNGCKKGDAHGEEHGVHHEDGHQENHETHNEDSHSDTHPEGDDHTHAEEAVGELDESGNFVYNTGGNIDLDLGEGEVLNIGENSTEAKLFDFLHSDVKVSDDKSEGWIVLDRVYFESGSSNLTEESSKQISNIAKILKKYPEAHVKFGGYTDNTGSLEVNQNISGQRAAQVANQVSKKGVNKENISSEGYGPKHPVCEANDTDICKAQNRRVDIKITKK